MSKILGPNAGYWGVFLGFKAFAVMFFLVDVPQPGLHYGVPTLAADLFQIPYGILWAGLNFPLWSGNLVVYQLYLFYVDAVFGFWLMRHVPLWRYVLYSFFSWYAMVDGFLKVSVYWTLSLVGFAPVWLLVSVLQWLPLGWSLDFRDAHFLNGLGPGFLWRFSTWVRPLGYSLAIVYGLVGLVVWLRNPNKSLLCYRCWLGVKHV